MCEPDDRAHHESERLMKTIRLTILAALGILGLIVGAFVLFLMAPFLLMLVNR